MSAGQYEAALTDENHSSDEHTGHQRYLRNILSLGYGFGPHWNGFLDLPYEYRVQRVNEESPHHQNETLSAPGDVHLRINYLWKNRVFGPGWRLYSGAGLILPTGSAYESNVFAPEADSVFHSHMVSGLGNYQFSMQGEAYYRSNFPVATGLVVNGRFPLWNPETAYSPGIEWSVLWTNYLHAIQVFSSVPRFNILVSGRTAESWSGDQWPNSGGWKFDIQGGWTTEISEFWAALFEVNIPVWQNYRGTQLSGVHATVTVRYLF
ncbi:MAG: hypothetical protein K9N46_16905 [Candidatus Marinimicrobia bacterium]|nr:hypothetical protein [Candidatus Neomarinimicrobiota bacterium]MCF7830341.1 hypothetical protein [Candidatus Neomarinimicrobiota bacterium]MCF7882409.1 hypothetical protein [Candidatus Neomarinimicrobiota bacterium]